MHNILTKEQQQKQAEFHMFAQENIKPLAHQIDQKEIVPSELITKIAQQGYLGAHMPRQYGGTEMDMITYGLLNKELGAACSSTKSLLTVHGMVLQAINRWGTQDQKKLWLSDMVCGKKLGAFGLTEPDYGSNAGGINTAAVSTGQEYILNGTKLWISFGQIADIFLLFADLHGQKTAFLIPRNTEGLSIYPIKGLLGLRGTMSARLVLNNCRISKENLLGRAGTGISHVALDALNLGRYTVAWGCVGLIQACLQDTIKYAKRRRQFGHALSMHQLIQKMIANMSVNLSAAQLLCIHAGTLLEDRDPNCIQEVCKAKYFSAAAAQKSASDAVQVHGANGCSVEYAVSRYYRDAKIMEIIEGTTQMHEIMIANQVIKATETVGGIDDAAI